MGVLVDSQSLVSDSAVLSGESTSPFEVADAMNKFKVGFEPRDVAFLTSVGETN